MGASSSGKPGNDMLPIFIMLIWQAAKIQIEKRRFKSFVVNFT